MAMMVQIRKTDAWYTKGQLVQVHNEVTMFRGKNGGKRIRHYLATETDQNGSMTRYKLIACQHASRVPSLTFKRARAQLAKNAIYTGIKKLSRDDEYFTFTATNSQTGRIVFLRIERVPMESVFNIYETNFGQVNSPWSCVDHIPVIDNEKNKVCKSLAGASGSSLMEAAFRS